ncbi:MAG: hypothetical protein B7Z15_11475 [Rhizobiales bacterium 32-66-8]|nr:MAG: hypothetical protein B7Z15_11475 [Rhizobiales bacterium 32-66-8]
MADFVTGRLPFERAARRLVQAGATDQEGAALLSACLQVEIDAGRLPYDLGLLLFEAVAQAIPSAQDSDAAPAPPAGTGATGAAEEVRETVESGQVSALLGPLKTLRRGGAPASEDTRTNPAERQLDAALDMFRGARARE